MALIATGTAAVTIGVTGLPAAHADQIRNKEWWLSSLGVTRAWTASRGAGVTVAVLSDGVQASQPDLAGAVTAAPAPPGAPQASGQYLGETGTPIASLIAGRGHGSGGSSGILGVAPAAKILSIPVTLPAGDPQLSQSGTAAAIPNAIAAGIRYAVRHRATIIDLPIDPGQPDSSGTPGASAAAGGSRAEQQAVSYALAHNVVLVAPAGDDGTSSDAPNYPAAYSGVIAVGAFNSAVIKAPWSSHKSYVTVTAPGAGVLAAANSGGYHRVNSTSAASAIVAGIATLIRAQYPGLSVDQVRSAITTSTVFGRTGGRADGSGYGTVNAEKAVAAAAVLATPKGSRAGAGARALVPPAAVSAASATRGLGSQVIRAGEISGGLFAALLLLIIVYAATGRRRRAVSPAVVTAQWAHRQGQSRYPQAGAADADRMLEAFATPVSEPARAGLASAAGFRGSVGSRAGDGLFAAVAGAATESGALPSHGPATRAVRPQVSGAPPWEAASTPKVSGGPPWEPASAPNSELPWTATVGRHSVGSRPAAAALPGGQTDQQGQESWRPGEPAGQSQFGPGGQPEPYHSAQAGWQPAESHAPADWDSPGASPGARHGGLPGRNPAQRGGDGWDGGRWNPSPAVGPVIEGSVLDSRSADHRRASSASYPGQYNQPGQYDEPGQDWPGSDRPEQPRITPSGLPVRTPRSATSAPAPLSPSGSLWERAEPEPGGYQDPSGYQSADGYQDSGQEPGSRPIYVWNPTDRRSARGYPPTTE